MRDARFWRWCFWVATAILLALLLMPMADSINSGILHLDKMVHALIFIGLTWLALRAWPGVKLLLLLGLFALAALTEILQSLTAWRTASFADFVADVAGVALVYCCHFFVKLLSYRAVRKTS